MVFVDRDGEEVHQITIDKTACPRVGDEVAVVFKRGEITKGVVSSILWDGESGEAMGATHGFIRCWVYVSIKEKK
jgi:hypothetical protein